MSKKESVYVIAVLKTVIYQREGFMIGVFQSSDNQKEFSGLGEIHRPEEGMAYKLRGTWGTHPKYGEQLSFDWKEIMQPRDTAGINRYLVRHCHGIGSAIANQLCDTYKEKTLEVMKTSPERVAAEIKGLTMERALEIQKKLKGMEHIEAAMVELEKMFDIVPGLPKNLAADLVTNWGVDAVDKVRENPYRIIELRGIGFLTADRLALTLGFDKKSSFREKACILHVLKTNMQQTGSVWMPQEELQEYVFDLTGLKGYTGLILLEKENEIKYTDGFYSIADVASNESLIASKIIELLTFSERRAA